MLGPMTRISTTKRQLFNQDLTEMLTEQFLSRSKSVETSDVGLAVRYVWFSQTDFGCNCIDEEYTTFHQ